MPREDWHRPEQHAAGVLRRLRVAVVITRLEGGAGQLALRGAKVMAEDVAELTIITGSGGALSEQATAAGLEVIELPPLRTAIEPRNDLRAFRMLAALFGERGFDVVHTHTAKAGTVGRMAARRAAAPRIVHTFHGFPFHEFQSPLRRGAYVAVERRLGRFTDVGLCVGAGVAAETVRRRLVAPERIRTIGVTVEDGAAAEAALTARAPEARGRARTALGIPIAATVVGAVGRLAYQKAPEDFIVAMRRLGRPEVIGVWVGGGELAERVARLARAQSGTQILLAGERSDVLDVLPAFDVFALTSRYEGLPTAIVEAMICGVPVAATAVNAVSDVVIPGETGLLVPPHRPDLMAAAIRYLLDERDVAARMAAAAHARLGNRYGESALRAALAAAYATAADQHVAGTAAASLAQ
jgi:glycosyltransferase involved in cell wall biosynthesis